METVDASDVPATNENRESSDNSAITQVIGIEQEQTGANQEILIPLIALDEPLSSTTINALKANDLKSKKCVNCTTEHLAELLSSLDGLKTLRHPELNNVYSCLENS